MSARSSLSTTLQVDAHPFKKWYESHYGVAIGVKKGKKAPPKEEEEVGRVISHRFPFLCCFSGSLWSVGVYYIDLV